MTGGATTERVAAFDRVAGRYDELWTNTAAGSAQREQVWRVTDSLFQSGQRILDVGCGTGADAAHFAARGIAVHATDCSAAMVAAARRRGGFTVSQLPAQDAASLAEVFDGAISNFGALNCVDDLPVVARGLAQVVRPGGRLAICTIGRCCAWETAYYGCRLQFAKAFRRWRGSAPSSVGITVHYPTVRQMESAFAPGFELVQWVGIGLLTPPSFVRLPSPIVRWLAACDLLLAGLPLCRAMADHRLLILVRK